MRSFNANFITEKNKRADGPSPINLLTFNFASPLYISDRDITPSGGAAHAGLIKSWGFIDSSISQTPGAGVLGQIVICDLQLTIINTQTPRFSDNFTSTDPPENVTVELYQWFDGLLYSEKEIIFKGVISRQPQYNEYECRITIRGIFEKYNKKIGDDLLITAADFPNADPDDIARMQNICYGNLTGVPCRAIESGGADNLFATITDSQTSIELSSASEFASSGIIGIDNEKISYTGKSGNTFTGCTRGYDSTTAVAHMEGTACWEELSRFVYQIAAHPVHSIEDIYADGLRVTAVATKYTGQTGNELSGYEGKAVFTVPARLTYQQAIDLLLTDGITIDDAIAIVDTIQANDTTDVHDAIYVSDWLNISDTIGVSDGITISDLTDVSDALTISDTVDVSDTIGVNTGNHGHTGAEAIAVWNFDTGVQDAATVNNPHLVADSDLDSQCTLVYSTGRAKVSRAFYQEFAGPPSQYRVCMKVSGLGGGTANFQFYKYVYASSDNSTVKSTWSAVPAGLDTWAKINAYYGYVRRGNENSNDRYIKEVWVEFKYTPTINNSAATGVAKTGSASKTGNVTRDGAVTKTGNVTRDGSVAKTGNVTRAGSVFKSGWATKTGAVTKTGSATRSGAVTRAGAVTLTGNSVADVKIGKLIIVDCEGYQDDASGTYTGTPAALIERPDHVFRHIWSEILGAPEADIDDTTFDASGTFFAANNYKFSLLINKPIIAENLLMKLALQCRSRFFVAPHGQAKLIVRQFNQSSGHSIIKNEIKRDSMSIQRSSTDDLINLFNIYYDLDHSQGSSPENYKSIKNFQDAASIAMYGQKEWKGQSDIFLFNAITEDAMAQHVGDFLLSYHSDVRKMPNFAVFLDNMEVEPGDIIDITHPLDNMTGFACEIMKIVHMFGSAKKKVIDHIKIIAAKNQE